MEVLLKVSAAEVKGHPDGHTGDHYPSTPQDKTDDQESYREGERPYEEPPSLGQDARLSSSRRAHPEPAGLGGNTAVDVATVNVA